MAAGSSRPRSALTVYELEGDGYGYEKGAFATAPLPWEDAVRRLTIGAGQGRFPGMLERRPFQITTLRPGHGTGIAASAPDRVVRREGQEVSVELP